MPPRLLVWVALPILLTLAVPLAAMAQSRPASPPKTFPYPIAETVLANGLKVVVVPMDSPGLMAHYIVVRAGSRNEVEPGLSGFAHFFEHMMFRGTKKYPAAAYNDVLERLGADSNAFTTDDWTCYHIAAAADALDKVMEVEADRFMNLEYSVEAFQKEAGAVLGEYNKNYSVPFMSLFEKLQDTAYEKHTYKHTTMGFLKDIEAMPKQYEYSLKFFDRWYRPENCVLVVAGDVKPDDVFALARRHYGPWKKGGAKLEVPVEPPQTREKTAHIAWKTPTLPLLVAAWHVPAWSPDSTERLALDVLAEAAFSETSPLYKDLVLDRQWVEDLSAGPDSQRDPGLFSVLARVKDPAKVDAVRNAVFATFEELAAKPLPEARIAEVKRRIRYAFLQSLQTADQTARTVSGFMQLTADPSAIDRTYATYAGVTAGDVQKAAAKFFTANNRTVVTLAPESQAVGRAAPIRTLLRPSAATPIVAFRVLFDAGAALDPPGKEGLAALTATMLSDGGTKRLTSAELLDALYPLAASVSVRADREVTVVQGTVHQDNLDAYAALLGQVLLEPRFDAADFERIKADRINYLKSVLRATDDENLGKEVLGAAMYAGHPYGRPVAGTVKGLEAITLDDVRAFFTANYTRERCTLGLAGGYPDTFVAKMVRGLEALPSAAAVRADLPRPRAPEGIETTVVTKPARAWAISIGYPLDLTRADDDFYALYLANSFLGEHRTFNGVLMNKIRGERGINYGDYSYVENFVQEGGSTFPLANTPRRQQFFSIWIRPVGAQHAHFAIRAAMREMRALVDNGLTREQFEKTRAFLLNYSRLFAQTPSRRLGFALDGEFYGKKSLVEELQARLPKMTVGDVNAAIRKHLQADNAFLSVVAGEDGAAAFVEALKSNAPSPITYATETKPEVLAEDAEIAVFPLKINAGKTRVMPAAEMFEKFP